MKFDYKVFKAFLISKDILELEGYNNILSTDSSNVFISTDYQYSKIDSNGSTAILIGYCFDIRNSEINNEKVLHELLTLEDSEACYEYMDYLNGRYCIFISSGNQLFVYSDATNMRPVFYNKEHNIVASHEYIVKEILSSNHNVNTEGSKYIRKNAMDWTDTEDIHKLSPSVELEYNSFTMKRIFPRKEKDSYSVQDVVNIMDPYMKEILKWLSKQDNKKFSLTGGVDSRVSLSVIKSLVHQIEFFTYMKEDKVLRSKSMQESYSNDQKIVKDLAYNLNLKHETFNIPTSINDSGYINMMKETMTSQHSYQLSHYLENTKKFQNALHIKSTVQSIGKSSFSTSLYKESNMENLLSGVKKWIPEDMKAKNKYAESKCEIANYLKRIDLDIKQTFNYHILDLIFLESRLGNFQSNITQETDKTLEVFNIFNSRKFIKLFLSVPLEDRQNQEIGKQLIETYWPILDNFELNSSPSLSEKYSLLVSNIHDTTNRDMFNDHQIMPVSNNGVSINETNNKFSLEIEKLPLSPEKVYKVQLFNFNTLDRLISINSNYNNENGRDVIIVKIDGIEKDIVDLYNGFKTTVNVEEYFELEFLIQKPKERNSWKNASRIFLECE